MGSTTHMESWEENSSVRVRKSHFRGVYRSGKRWKAQIQIGGEQHYLGTYDSEESAARAYDIKAKELRGRRASTNFDEHGNETLESLIRREKLRQSECDEEEANEETGESKMDTISKAGTALTVPDLPTATTATSSTRSPSSSASSAAAPTMRQNGAYAHIVPASMPLYPPTSAAYVLPGAPPLTHKQPRTRQDAYFLNNPTELRARLCAVSQSLQHAKDMYDYQCKCVGGRPDLIDPYLDAVVVLSIQYDDIVERLKRLYREYR